MVAVLRLPVGLERDQKKDVKYTSLLRYSELLKPYILINYLKTLWTNTTEKNLLGAMCQAEIKTLNNTQVLVLIKLEA